MSTIRQNPSTLSSSIRLVAADRSAAPGAMAAKMDKKVVRRSPISGARREAGPSTTSSSANSEPQATQSTPGGYFLQRAPWAARSHSESKSSVEFSLRGRFIKSDLSDEGPVKWTADAQEANTVLESVLPKLTPSSFSPIEYCDADMSGPQLALVEDEHGQVALQIQRENSLSALGCHLAKSRLSVNADLIGTPLLRRLPSTDNTTKSAYTRYECSDPMPAWQQALFPISRLMGRTSNEKNVPFSAFVGLTLQPSSQSDCPSNDTPKPVHYERVVSLSSLLVGSLPAQLVDMGNQKKMEVDVSIASQQALSLSFDSMGALASAQQSEIRQLKAQLAYSQSTHAGAASSSVPSALPYTPQLPGVVPQNVAGGFVTGALGLMAAAAMISSALRKRSTPSNAPNDL